jgi:hypothetical protein
VGLLTGHCYLDISSNGLVDSSGYGRCKQVLETVLHVLCDFKALAKLRFRHLGQHFPNPCYFEDVSIARYCTLFKGWGC